MKTILTLLFVALSAHCMAQGISGKVLDEKKEPIINAVIQVFSAAGIPVGGNITDYDGNYQVKPLDPGNYYVLARYTGYDSITITEIPVIAGYLTRQNFELSKKSGGNHEHKSKYIKPLVDVYLASPATYNDISDLIGITPGPYQHHGDREPTMGGARREGTQYIIDGVMVLQPVDTRLTEQAYNKWWNERLASASTGYKFTREDLAAMPISDLRDVASLIPGVYQARRGDDLSIFGARSGGTQYIVDGVRR